MSDKLELVRYRGLEIVTPCKLWCEGKMLVAFGTRRGGVSQAPFHSLNLGFHVGDRRENVLENRLRFCLGLGLNPARLTAAEQVHGSKVVVVTEDKVGQGAFSDKTSLPGVDGLVTNIKGVALALFFADCVPVVAVGVEKKIVGIAHAGWRGIYEGVIPRLVEVMMEVFDTAAEKLQIFIGPSIGPCCYKVEESIMEKFAQRFPEVMAGLGENNHLNLALIGKRQLEKAGVKEKNIHLSNLCTSCRTDLFFSYRASGGRTGRQAGLVAIVG